jgi:transcriptional regulator with XRE-family HTH domain
MTLLRTRRLERGVTMTSLAINAQIPVSALSRIEAGARCSQATAAKLAKALGVTVQEIFPNYSTLRPF